MAINLHQMQIQLNSVEVRKNQEIDMRMIITFKFLSLLQTTYDCSIFYFRKGYILLSDEATGLKI